MKFLRKTIREQIDFLLNQNKFLETFHNHLLFLTVFTKENLEEENIDFDERNKVINLIKDNQWITPTAKEFRNEIVNSKHSKMLTPYSESELKQMKLFKLKDYHIGYALKKKNGKFSEIVSVFNNEPNIKNIGIELVQNAVKNGGCYLDHFDGFLTDLYSKLGFVETNRIPYNSKYDKNNEFQNKYGKQDIIYRIHKSCLEK